MTLNTHTHTVTMVLDMRCRAVTRHDVPDSFLTTPKKVEPSQGHALPRDADAAPVEQTRGGHICSVKRDGHGLVV